MKTKEDIEMTLFNSDVTANYFGQGVSLEMLTQDELKKYLEDISELAEKNIWVKLVVIKYLEPTRGWNEDALIKRLKEIKKDIRLVQKKLLMLH